MWINRQDRQGYVEEGRGGVTAEERRDILAVSSRQCHIVEMDKRDKRTADLLCPECGRKGIAELSQAGKYSYLVGNALSDIDALSTGFKAADKRSAMGGVDIHCSQCNVSSWR
jgi:VCBS repeat-containing protein